ncbi:MAG TPA: PEP-CTERM sorting domain-containing protein [Phycisphaerae bacterium]|nr:PEP-CTERM sorting domain-containing protein [Phycisphaerae bacterium]
MKASGRSHHARYERGMTSLKRRSVLMVLAVAPAALWVPGSVTGATLTWTGGANDGLWSSGNNWSNSTAPATGDVIFFGSTIGATGLLTDDDPASIVSLAFGGPADVAGAASAFTFSVGGSAVNLNITGSLGDHSANGNVQTFNLPVAAGSMAYSGTGNSIMVFNSGATVSGGLASTTNGVADTLAIGTGAAVTFGASSTIGGASTANVTTSLNVTGGALSFTSSLSLGSSNNTGSGTATNTSMDLSGLANFSLNAATGSLNLGTGNRTNATLTLANTNNTINAVTVNVGNFANSAGLNNDALHLGGGSNTIQTANMTIGRGVSGTLDFAGPGGQVSILGINGGAALANVTVGVGEANSTSASLTSALNLAGHAANLNLNTLVIAQNDLTNFNGVNNATVNFDAGTFNVQTVLMSKVSNPHGKANANLTIGGGTLNVTSAFDIIDNTYDTTNPQTSVLNLNGGLANFTSSIDVVIAGSNASGTANSTINFNGGTLNMNQHAIGASGNSAAGYRANVDNINMPGSGHTFTLMNLGKISATTGGTTVADGINGAGLTMDGAGTLILEGTNNGTYGYGQTTVTSGVLQVGSGANTGTLGTGTATVIGGTLRFNRSDTVSVSNVIAGGANGTVEQAGVGTLILTVGNTYSGSTTVSAGELDIASSGSIASGNVLVSSGATFAVLAGGNITSTPDLTNNGTVNFNNSACTIASLNGAAAGAVVNLNTTNLTVSGGGSYAGAINDGGTNAAMTISTALFVGSFNIGTVNANANLQIHGTSKTAALKLTGGTGAWSSGLDLTTSRFILESSVANKSSDLSRIRDQVAFGKNHTSGIFTSSTLAANFAIAVVDNAVVNKTSFGGVAVDSSSILVGAELLGDANIDGHVDLADLSTVLNNFGTATLAWTSGNFDGAPTIDLTDLSGVLNNFGLSNPKASDQPILASASAAISTPEPASLAVPGLGAVAMLSRRRRA